MPSPRPQRFGRVFRIRLARDFRDAYRHGRVYRRHPLTIFALARSEGPTRLGLSVPRRVGTAVRRNRIKRLLREAFRRVRPAAPAGYDVVVNVKPHEPLTRDEYARRLEDALASIARACPTPPDPRRPRPPSPPDR